MSTPARVVVADPAWLFRDALPGRKRGASKHYDCLSTPDICKLELPPIARDAVLFLWRVASMPRDALDVCKAWGFTPKSELVWIKTTKTSGPNLGTSKLAFGMGHQVRGAHETCIIATRGKCPPRSRSVRSVFFAPVGIHSAKPDVFFEIVEAMHEGPYVELFARCHRTGWDCYGNEIGTALEVA